ncbi:DUF305 domain-containing protein [Qaidamihabitans albus]|uniref:DUF305 domain-containing protein n=1 Tax=Qaidamihabitans albus TaxID=2795733 RepID=UPI0018F112E6|nr:DUF305 domain-containing protein [Qaidamihabitans albus]
MGSGVGRARLAAAGVVAVFVLAGCVSDPEPPEDAAAEVIVPGRPGESASAAAPQGADTVAPNEADVRYMTMMIPHHRQAITMTDLVADRASDRQVRAIAGRIAAAQDAEITAMTDWLAGHGHGQHTEHGGDGEHGAHGDDLMPGMATPEQIDALRAAGGAEFDRLFLQLMITHHEGALTMAEDELAHGIEPRALEMAQDVLAGQAAEIERMRNLLGR